MSRECVKMYIDQSWHYRNPCGRTRHLPTSTTNKYVLQENYIIIKALIAFLTSLFTEIFVAEGTEAAVFNISIDVDNLLLIESFDETALAVVTDKVSLNIIHTYKDKTQVQGDKTGLKLQCGCYPWYGDYIRRTSRPSCWYSIFDSREYSTKWQVEVG